MSAEKIRTATEAGLNTMGSCNVFALWAVGFDNIPIEATELAVRINNRRFKDGIPKNVIPDLETTVLKKYGYSDWQKEEYDIQSKKELIDKSLDCIRQGKRVALHVDYGDGKNAHVIGLVDIKPDGAQIGGDLKFIGEAEPYAIISTDYLWHLMSRNPGRLGFKKNNMRIFSKK